MNYKDKIEEIIENGVSGFVCECGGGGTEGGEICDKCKGTGIYDWNYSFAVTELSALYEQAQRDAIEGFAKWYDQDVFPEKGYAEQMVGKYLNQTKEDLKEKQ